MPTANAKRKLTSPTPLLCQKIRSKDSNLSSGRLKGQPFDLPPGIISDARLIKHPDKMLDTIDTKHDHGHGQNRFAVIPTSDKLGVNPQYSGRGIRIAFLDSGFYPHPDFARRVIAFHDIAGEDR